MEHTLCDVTLGANVTENQTAVIINRASDMLIGSVLLYANAVVAAGGGECDAYVQTKVGGDWIDVANFHFTTSSAAKFYNLSTRTVVTSIGTAASSPMADNTCVIRLSVTCCVCDSLRPAPRIRVHQHSRS
jgi:hypothetical protein